jgi:two-component sensor histidine kinase
VQQVAVDQYLSGLLEDLRRSADSDRAAQVTLDADPVDTHTDGAVAVGVIVNELVMNALKYAYPDSVGPIRVILKTTGPESAIVSVEDDGVGFKDTDNPTSTGLGQRIVKAMASKINGDIKHDQRAPGTRVSVAFSLVGRTPKMAGSHATAS